MTASASGPLQGVRIVITRPARQSAGLAQQIAALGGKPVMFPAIVILPPTDRSALERAQRDLAHYDYAVFVSANAVEYGVGDPGSWPAHLVALAPGPGTATALAAAGIDQVRSPTTTMDSEGLLALPELADVKGKRIAIPGPKTSAYLALRLYEPDFEAVFIPFDQIEDAVVDGKVDMGLLIHEGQLTFGERGLHLVADMGEWWFGETGLPLPLGGNVVRKDLGEALLKKISRHLRASIAYALDHRELALDHAMRYARGLDRSKADTFVGMYVNDWTLDYGERGREAIRQFLARGVAAGIIPHEVTVEFVAE